MPGTIRDPPTVDHLHLQSSVSWIPLGWLYHVVYHTTAVFVKFMRQISATVRRPLTLPRYVDAPAPRVLPRRTSRGPTRGTRDNEPLHAVVLRYRGPHQQVGRACRLSRSSAPRKSFGRPRRAAATRAGPSTFMYTMYSRRTPR